MPDRVPAGQEMTSAERTALYRTLANPLRGQILRYLGEHGEANSTALAQFLGESTGTTSYHLRKLAGLHLIEEIPDRSRGRERWWRPLPFSHTMPDPATMEPAEYAAAEHLARLKMSRDIDLYIRANKEWAGPEGWAQVQRYGSHLTRDELSCFMAEYRALLEKYAHSPEDAPKGARPMMFRFFAVPEDSS